MPALLQERLKQYKARLALWFTLKKKSGWGRHTFDGPCHPLPLFYVGPGEHVAAAADEDVRGHAILCLYSDGKKNTQYVFANKCRYPRIGDVIELGSLEMEYIWDQNDVSRLESRKTNPINKVVIFGLEAPIDKSCTRLNDRNLSGPACALVTKLRCFVLMRSRRGKSSACLGRYAQSGQSYDALS